MVCARAPCRQLRGGSSRGQAGESLGCVGPCGPRASVFKLHGDVPLNIDVRDGAVPAAELLHVGLPSPLQQLLHLHGIAAHANLAAPLELLPVHAGLLAGLAHHGREVWIRAFTHAVARLWPRRLFECQGRPWRRGDSGIALAGVKVHPHLQPWLQDRAQRHRPPRGRACKGRGRRPHRTQGRRGAPGAGAGVQQPDQVSLLHGASGGKSRGGQKSPQLGDAEVCVGRVSRDGRRGALRP
mmetsp:Transcript_63934/g.170704  ORF Transcript_63934/g.170704 Transcript_63934/m.170704 type:complete len:240 (+) Transcript_63934:80-799(+)